MATVAMLFLKMQLAVQQTQIGLLMKWCVILICAGALQQPQGWLQNILLSRPVLHQQQVLPQHPSGG